MIIEANGQQIEAFNVYEDAVIRGPQSYPALVFRLLEMPTADQLAALAGGDLTIGGITYTGYTNLADIVLTLFQMSEEAQQVEQLTAQVAQQAEMVLQAQAAVVHAEEQVATMQTEVATAQAETQAKTVQLNAIALALPDDLAVQHVDIYPELLGNNEAVMAGQRRRFNNELYKANVTLWDRADQWPDAQPTLWTKITQSGGIEDWVQPTGAHDAYYFGDVRAHKGKVWRSTVENDTNGNPRNVWEPGVYGWEEVVE